MGSLKTYFSFVVMVSVLALVSCSPSVPNSPTNDTLRLDKMAKDDAQSAEFVRRVKLFYQALQNKDWSISYDMRMANYKQLVTKETYFRQMTEDEKGWNLDSYKILNISLSGNAGGNRAAQLIIETSEGGMDCYNCAVWKYEGGTWLCEDPGISSKAILHSLVRPDWDKN